MSTVTTSDLTVGTRAAALNAVRGAILQLHKATYFSGHLHGWAEQDGKILAAVGSLEKLHAELASAPMPLGDDRELLSTTPA